MGKNRCIPHVMPQVVPVLLWPEIVGQPLAPCLTTYARLISRGRADVLAHFCIVVANVHPAGDFKTELPGKLGNPRHISPVRRRVLGAEEELPFLPVPL